MDALERYVHEHSAPEEELLHELDRETNLRAVAPRMLSGHIQGRMLEMFVRMIRPRLTNWKSSPNRGSTVRLTGPKSASTSDRPSTSPPGSAKYTTSYSSTATNANTPTTTGC